VVGGRRRTTTGSKLPPNLPLLTEAIYIAYAVISPSFAFYSSARKRWCMPATLQGILYVKLMMSCQYTACEIYEI
jgi:hypothetical protein